MAPHRALVTPAARPRAVADACEWTRSATAGLTSATFPPPNPGHAHMTSQTQPAVALNDGATMPQFGLGVFQTPPDETERVVKMAVEEGYRLVDTASMYRNEEGVGGALLGRADIFVTTKLGNSDHGFDATLRAFDESMRRLRRDTARSLSDPLAAPARQSLCRKLEGVRPPAKGRADPLDRRFELQPRPHRADHRRDGVAPAVNQIELHPRFQQRSLRAFHDEQGIKTESWSPLGRGGLLSDPAIVEIAAKHRRTPAQVVIRWHLDSGLIVIPKTVRLERLKENIGAVYFKLGSDDMQRIEALDSPNGRMGPDPAAATF